MKAFPHTYEKTIDGHIATCTNTGMDLRDWFAGQFIPLICKYSDRNGWDYENNARVCYAMADAMMKARGQE
jgi:hypothetical protein